MFICNIQILCSVHVEGDNYWKKHFGTLEFSSSTIQWWLFYGHHGN